MSSYVTRTTPGNTAWFRHDRFGMFIHWGLYALPARHEWIKNMEEIPDEKYQKYFGNVEVYDNDNTRLSGSQYQYMVRTNSTKASFPPKEKKNTGGLDNMPISGEYYWIISKQGSVVFYQN